VNFQVTVLKILVSYPDGFAAMADLKRDMAILATSGREWTERTKRLASRVPDLTFFLKGSSSRSKPATSPLSLPLERGRRRRERRQRRRGSGTSTGQRLLRGRCRRRKWR
jgi:hypothetical protein